MGLASSLSTALTGINAAETQIDVLGNNLANSQTVGFKSSEVIFATQFLQTLSLGAAPSTDNGGTDPRQTGLGVQVSGISPNFSQGTVQISSSPSDLAIQGDGLFIVQGSSNEQLYTRAGIFKLNSENQLVTPTGNRLLGYGIDDQFRVQSTKLVPLEIPLGSEAVAQATKNVVMEGTLTPTGDVADTAEVIQSPILGDAAVPRPDASGISLASSAIASTAGVTVAHNEGSGSLVEGAVYQYKFSFVDASGHESVPSAPLSVTVPPGDSLPNNAITLTGLPDAPGEYSQVRVYRTDANGSEFKALDTVATGGVYVDDGNTVPGATLDETLLNGNYSYMITYYHAGDPETRPSIVMGPQNIVNGRVQLSDFPAPPVPPSGGGHPPYDSVRIYRNTASDQNSFYLVDTVAPGQDYTDSKSDAEISNLTLPGNKGIDLDGPSIDSNTLLTNVVRRDGLDYINPFTLGSLEFEAAKGGRTLESKQFEVTATSTLQDLVSFMEEAMGIQTQGSDTTNPVPGSKNTIPGETGTLLPGAYIQNGRIRFVSNNGVDNALDIDLTGFRVTDSSGVVNVPNMAFGSVQDAKGQSAVADFIAYDTLGVPIRTRITTVLESRTDTSTTYRWYADSADNSARDGSEISVGTGLIQFDGNGNYISATNTTVAIDRFDLPSVSPMEFKLDFTGMSGLATSEASIAASRQDGSPPGTLTSYVIGEDGTIRGVFSNGIARDLGQLQLAKFSNPEGLEQRGQNLFSQGINTGLPIQGRPGENGIGAVVSGALELSNTDIGGDLVDLVLASTQYRANSRVITATQQLFDELLNIR
ncbi:flagellar hook-basal body complex protein [Aureliella helgolandensis]|uniref:Flagellar hook protein FlgE n=1 Tax=Aureliella helgolandensis TaxID=2527968 RepID=A0A518GEU7_9BACT|nr:flagellar hook-basal body complex protein [Aureliella helgolandensis]QDV27126.1 Flagellar hook protein FlgE [Aureliella helgolandensis]